MATVIQIPKDTRFGSIGAGLGQAASAFVEKREADEKKKKRESALAAVLEEVDTNPEVNRAGLMAILGGDFDPQEQAVIINSAMKEKEQREHEAFLQSQQDDQQEHQAGLQDDAQAFQGAEGEANRQQQGDLKRLEIDAQKVQKDLDRQLQREEGEANRGVQREQIKEPGERARLAGDAMKIEGIEEDLEKGDYAAAVGKIMQSDMEADDKNNAIAILIRAQSDVKAAAAAGEKDKSKENKFKVTLPDGSTRDIIAKPGETGQQAVARLKEAKELPPNTELKELTEKQRDVEGIARETGLDLNDPEQSSIARAIANTEEDITDRIVEDFKISREFGGVVTRIFGDKLSEKKAELASGSVRDIMVGGTTNPGDVREQAKQQGIERFNSLEWVPENIRETKNIAAILDYARVNLGWGARDLEAFAKERFKMPQEQINDYITRAGL